jgi:adenylate cyclase
MTITLGMLRRCFEGAVPAVVATCGLDGTPNVALLSQVHYINEQHVALSYQFFNTTRRNILENPRATAQIIDPVTAVHYRLHIEYLHTETDGPLFESMKAKLAGIASHTGMSKVFQGSDVYRVLRIEQMWPEGDLSLCTESSVTLAALRLCLHELARCPDLACLFDATLASLNTHFRMAHTMLLMLDHGGARLYTVASHGYEASGVGSEIALGEGIIGVAAREHTPIRIGHMAQEYLYSCAVRQSFLQSASAPDLETEIPLPGLSNPEAS